MLSDACFDFAFDARKALNCRQNTVKQLANRLLLSIERYSAKSYDYYPPVIEALTAITNQAIKEDKWEKLIATCRLTTMFYDALPEYVDEAVYYSAMEKLKSPIDFSTQELAEISNRVSITICKKANK